MTLCAKRKRKGTLILSVVADLPQDRRVAKIGRGCVDAPEGVDPCGVQVQDVPVRVLPCVHRVVPVPCMVVTHVDVDAVVFVVPLCIDRGAQCCAQEGSFHGVAHSVI